MNSGLSRPFHILFFLAVIAPSVSAHPDISVTLENHAKRIRENPKAYEARAERTWLLMDHGDSGGTAQEDIDTLLAHPEWRGQGLRLKAYRLFLLGRNEEAKSQILENLRGKKSDGPEQLRMLARIQLGKSDTGAAIQAYHLAWDRRHEEEDYVVLLALHAARRNAPAELLRQGLVRHSRSPGATEAIFKTHWEAGSKSDLKRCLEISTQAVAWWPRSVDWKVRHAKALMGTGQGRKAEAPLLAALELLDESARLDPNANTTTGMRKEIFNLMESVKK